MTGFKQIFGSKIQDFFQTFYKTIIYFSRLKDIKWVINGDLKKRRNKDFFMKHFIIFPDLISIFQTFSRSEKLLGKFQDFFKNLRLCTNPDMISRLGTLRDVHHKEQSRANNPANQLCRLTDTTFALNQIRYDRVFPLRWVTLFT